MATDASFHFILTLKGSEELTTRSYRLDARLRNILFLIQKGSATFETIVQHSIFPPDEVIERVRGLINEKFIAMSSAAAAVAPAAQAAAAAPAATAARAASPAPRAPAGAAASAPRTLTGAFAGPATAGLRAPTRAPVQDFPLLDNGVSLSQARFALADFCLDVFGAHGQAKMDRISEAVGVNGLQRIVDEVIDELRGKRNEAALEALAAKIREINENRV